MIAVPVNRSVAAPILSTITAIADAGIDDFFQSHPSPPGLFGFFESDPESNYFEDVIDSGHVFQHFTGTSVVSSPVDMTSSISGIESSLHEHVMDNSSVSFMSTSAPSADAFSVHDSFCAQESLADSMNFQSSRFGVQDDVVRIVGPIKSTGPKVKIMNQICYNARFDEFDINFGAKAKPLLKFLFSRKKVVLEWFLESKVSKRKVEIPFSKLTGLEFQPQDAVTLVGIIASGAKCFDGTLSERKTSYRWSANVEAWEGCDPIANSTLMRFVVGGDVAHELTARFVAHEERFRNLFNQPQVGTAEISKGVPSSSSNSLSPSSETLGCDKKATRDKALLVQNQLQNSIQPRSDLEIASHCSCNFAGICPSCVVQHHPCVRYGSSMRIYEQLSDVMTTNCCMDQVSTLKLMSAAPFTCACGNEWDYSACCHQLFPRSNRIPAVYHCPTCKSCQLCSKPCSCNSHGSSTRELDHQLSECRSVGSKRRLSDASLPSDVVASELNLVARNVKKVKHRIADVANDVNLHPISDANQLFASWNVPSETTQLPISNQITNPTNFESVNQVPVSTSREDVAANFDSVAHSSTSPGKKVTAQVTKSAPSQNIEQISTAEKSETESIWDEDNSIFIWLGLEPMPEPFFDPVVYNFGYFEHAPMTADEWFCTNS